MHIEDLFTPVQQAVIADPKSSNGTRIRSGPPLEAA